MVLLLRLRKLYLLIIDTIIVNLAVVGGLWLRFEGRIPSVHLQTYHRAAVPFTLASLLIFAFFGLYSVILRYASVDEMLAVAAGSGVSTGVLWVLVRYWLSSGFPRSSLILTGILEFLALGGYRISVRLFIRVMRRLPHIKENGEVTRVLIVGAGDAGAVLGKELTKPADPHRKLVGYIDDDKAKKGSTLCGVKVFGGRDQIPDVVRREGVKEIIIAMPSQEPGVIKEIVDSCHGLGVRIRALPRLLDMAGRVPELQMVRDIDIEDLLGRPEVKLDTDQIKKYIAGKRVLVTGAGGSIGSEICRQVAKFEPEVLILLGHGENPIFEISRELEEKFPRLKKKSVIADVRDSVRIHDVFALYRPDVVFHAAAHKHVPLMEDNLTEAIKTNVFGTLNVARAALAFGSEKFVMISTDKAVNPTSIMGVSKRIAEMVVQAINMSSEKTAFLSVRFGNVLGSRGSVVPIFREQIAKGGPVTVTHPEMKRYFMTIREAVQLVLQAGTMGKGGEIFVLDMGEPVRIVDLAEQMIRLSGKTPYVDIDIVFSGIRPGEKLFEEILTAEEGTTATHHSQIFIARQKPFRLDTFKQNLKLLESLVFPNEYSGAVFDLNFGEENLTAGREETAATDWIREDESEKTSPETSVGLWGRHGDHAILSDRSQEIIEVLKLLVPSYSGGRRERKKAQGYESFQVNEDSFMLDRGKNEVIGTAVNCIKSEETGRSGGGDGC